ncbi:MAG: hypothetical protein KME31_10045 [Tolypothrix carrinoi HA7290-LM1]|nr:hypothetical protein [Tolypothrix carrinoi HA7290-LM1]
MGNGQWELGIGNAFFTITHAPCPMPHAQCPMTADASTEGTSARHCLPNAPCPNPYFLSG